MIGSGHRDISRSLLVGVLLFFSAACDSPEPSLQDVNESPNSRGVAVLELPALPVAVSNNAVAWLQQPDRTLLFSFMGIGSAKNWSDIRRDSFVFDSSTRQWRVLPPVPGRQGRIAATAAGVGGKVYLFGGYEVAEDGHEVSSPAVDIFDPSVEEWTSGSRIPVPVDDSVSGVYRGRYIYLVSGWSENDNVDNVQVYDTVEDSWSQATPIPGRPVFGHAGGLVEGSLVYCDGAHYNEPGATPRYVATDECWVGSIDADDLTAIDWRRVDPHPGTARYRSAAGSSIEDRRVYFSGGTDNPYNIDGVGYDSVPSEPASVTFAWDLAADGWIVVNESTPNPTMDHRGLIPFDGGLVRLGGMEPGQSVTATVNVEKVRSEE